MKALIYKKTIKEHPYQREDKGQESITEFVCDTCIKVMWYFLGIPVYKSSSFLD